MSAVFWKELRELRIALIALALVGGIVGLGLKSDDEIAMAMVVTVGLLGVPLGAWQGRADREAVRDQFLLHRPVATSQIHAARTAAGALAAVVVAAVPLAVMLLVPVGRGLPVFGEIVNPSGTGGWTDVTPGRVAFAAFLCVVTWAAARLGASARRAAVAALGALLFPAVLAAGVMRVSQSYAAATLYAAVALALAVATSRVSLVRRSEGRGL
jgi:hypothetical protein